MLLHVYYYDFLPDASRMNLNGKVVLITGASKGIGAACAKAFAARGAQLSLTARTESELQAAGNDSALVVAGDITDDATRQRVVKETVERYGTIDVLVNNAGAGLYVPAYQAPLAQARAQFDLNFFAPLALTQLVVPFMRKQKSGTLVNISSIAGKVTLPWLSLYSASKQALCSLTDGLRMELKRDGIHAISVCPGYVDTGFQQHILGGEAPWGIRKRRPLGITAEGCAEAIVRGVERDARTVLAPATGWLLVGFSRLFPSLVDWQLERMYLESR